MTAIVVPVPVPVSALPLPDSADLATWPARMKELHRWMREDAAAFISDLGESAYQNALHAVTMADSAAGSANFKGAWSSLTGALNMPASVSHSGRLWLLTENLANVTTATPGVSGSWLDITNFLMGVSTASAARTAIDVYSKAESLALAPAKNLIDNSNFAVNQRAVSGTVTLAAGAYGHDRWKGGASGGTYTFAAYAGINTVTVSSGSLVQVVDGLNLETATYTLSHSGTAQVRVVGGSYASGPITVSATAGTNLSLEFGPGTIKQVKLEKGTTQTAWVMPDYYADEAKCRVYLMQLTGHAMGLTQGVTDAYSGVVHFDVRMRASPTLVAGATFTVGAGSAGTVSLSAASRTSALFRNSANNWTTGAFVYVTALLSAEI